MTQVTLVSSFTNANRRRRTITGHLIGQTPTYWVIRAAGERLNQVLPYDDWVKQ